MIYIDKSIDKRCEESQVDIKLRMISEELLLPGWYQVGSLGQGLEAEIGW